MNIRYQTLYSYNTTARMSKEQVRECLVGKVESDDEPMAWLIRRSSGEMQECRVINGDGYTATVQFTSEAGVPMSKTAPIPLLLWWTNREGYFSNFGNGRWIRKIGSCFNSCSSDLCQIVQGWYYIDEETETIKMMNVRELLVLMKLGVLSREFASAHLDRRVASGDEGEDLDKTFRSPTMREWLATLDA